jgi:hypothetical protein
VGPLTFGTYTFQDQGTNMSNLSSKERPQFVPAVRKPKLPYLCAAAECVTCKRHVSGDWGLVPDECETCDAERQARYYRSVAQWAEEEVGRLKAMLAARAPQDARACLTCGEPLPDHWSFSFCNKHRPPVEPLRAPLTPYGEDLLAEAVRMLEGYKRAGWLTNPAAIEHASDFIARASQTKGETPKCPHCGGTGRVWPNGGFIAAQCPRCTLQETEGSQ